MATVTGALPVGLGLNDRNSPVFANVSIADGGTLLLGTSGAISGVGALTMATVATTGTITAGGRTVVTAVNGLTALAGGAQAGTALTADINRVTTVTTAADSVQLPAATPGLRVTVINAAAANAMAVFPQTGEIINALSANASISVAANKTIIFSCAVAGTWNSLLTA